MTERQQAIQRHGAGLPGALAPIRHQRGALEVRSPRVTQGKLVRAVGDGG